MLPVDLNAGWKDVQREAFFIFIDNPQSDIIVSISFQNLSVRMDGSATILMSSRRPKAKPLMAESDDGEVRRALILLITGF